MVEHHPNEVFIHMSATRLWDMVRERVNLEITKQHKMGRINLPCLQPHESVDGLEMFGLSSPAVMQVSVISFTGWTLLPPINRLARISPKAFNSRPFFIP